MAELSPFSDFGILYSKAVFPFAYVCYPIDFVHTFLVVTHNMPYRKSVSMIRIRLHVRKSNFKVNTFVHADCDLPNTVVSSKNV